MPEIAFLVPLSVQMQIQLQNVNFARCFEGQGAFCMRLRSAERHKRYTPSWTIHEDKFSIGGFARRSGKRDLIPMNFDRS